MFTVPHFSFCRLHLSAGFVFLAALTALCAQTRPVTDAAAPLSGSIASAADEWPSVTIGFIGESRYQPQTVAALAGAIDAARDLGPKHRLHVSVAHRSPEIETAAAQNEALRQLFVDDTAGVLIYPVDAQSSAALLALLNRQRMPVVTFGTPETVAGISAAVVYDEVALGEALSAEAFRLLDGRAGRRSGGVAILAGPKDKQPYATRTRAATRTLEASASYKSYGAFNCEANMTSALQTLRKVTAAERNEGLNVWISVGGWPIMGHHANLPKAMGLAGFVVGDALPQMLPYLERGEVFALVSPDYYGAGYEAMRQVLLAQEARRTGAAQGRQQPAGAKEAAEAGAETSAEEASVTAAAGVSPLAAAAGSVAVQSVLLEDAVGQPQDGVVTQVKILPLTIRRENLAQYAQQWADWLARSM